MKKQTENTTQTPPGEIPEGVNGRVQPPVAAGGSDLEQLQTENEQLKATIRQTEAHRQITGELGKAGARSPDLLFDAVKADLQFDGEGNLQNAAALMQKLRTSFPEQFGYERPVESIDGGAGRGGAATLTKEALATMKPSEIAELDWAEVRRVLSL